MGGLRDSENGQDYNYIRSGLLSSRSPSSAGISSDSVVTYSTSVQYRLAEDGIVYGKVSSGYRPGGPQVVSQVGLTLPTKYDPDTVTNYEGGLKFFAFDRRLSVNASAFHIDWSRIQLLGAGVVAVQGVPQRRFLLTNAGQASSDGFDFAVTARPVAGLTVNASGAYTDAHLDQAAPQLGAAKGERIPYNPLWSLNGSMTYAFPISENVVGDPSAAIRFVGSRTNYFSADPSGNLQATMRHYTILDLRAGATIGAYDIAFRVSNVTNERAILAAQTDGYATTPPYSVLNDSAVVSRPRTFGLGITRSW